MEEKIELCAFCHRPMQVADRVYDKGVLVSLRYVCNCRGTLYHVNVHSGDKTRRDTK